MKNIFFFLLFSCLFSGNRQADVWTTRADRSLLLEKTSVKLKSKGPSDAVKVTIDPSVTYQSITGFGPAITGASGYNILRMSPSDRKELLEDLFSPEKGLGMSLVRVSIGSSDFGLDEYTCCDVPGIEHFKIHELDRRDVFPLLKEIYAINPSLKIIGSPWSAPKWMKRAVEDDSDFDSWTSGRLKKECYGDYAEYFVKWVQAMRAEGFDVYAVTVQNEPLNHGNSMSMYMTWEEQRDFIRDALGPAFRKAGIEDVRILAFDHNYNYDRVESQKRYPLRIFEDPRASAFIAGSAWHNYGGNVRELEYIVSQAPDKEIYFTEASIGTWNYDFAKCLVSHFKSIFLQTMQYGCKGVTLWNLALDENRRPFRPGGCGTCYGAVEVNSVSHKVTDRKTHYYNLAHASLAAKPGAVRVSSEGKLPPAVSCMAFKDGSSFGAMIANEGSIPVKIDLTVGNKHVIVESPGNSIQSVVW